MIFGHFVQQEMACAMISTKYLIFTAREVQCSLALAAGGWTRHKGDAKANLCGLIYLSFLVENLPLRQIGGSRVNSSSANKHSVGNLYIQRPSTSVYNIFSQG